MSISFQTWDSVQALTRCNSYDPIQLTNHFAIDLMDTDDCALVDGLIRPHVHGDVTNALSSVQINGIRHPVLVRARIDAGRTAV